MKDSSKVVELVQLSHTDPVVRLVQGASYCTFSLYTREEFFSFFPSTRYCCISSFKPFFLAASGLFHDC